MSPTGRSITCRHWRALGAAAVLLTTLAAAGCGHPPRSAANTVGAVLTQLFKDPELVRKHRALAQYV